jgi:fucose permease
MNADKLFNVLGAIVGVALATTLVIHPNTSRVVDSAGRAFSNSLRAAMGR